MPIYAYRCATCGHAKDVLQKLSDPLLTACPSCGAETFRKQLTAAGFQLKGSGWYVTDFKGGAPAPKPDAPKPEAGAPPAAEPAPAAAKSGPDTSASPSPSPSPSPAPPASGAAPAAP